MFDLGLTVAEKVLTAAGCLCMAVGLGVLAWEIWDAISALDGTCEDSSSDSSKEGVKN